MKRITRTLRYPIYRCEESIGEKEAQGWRVRQIVPLVDSEPSYPGSFTRDVLVVFEKEERQ